MANSLLDFVMSLVRDPDAAARYAADPTQAIADANLTGVTSADVSNLIPVVSESLSMGAPTAGADAALDGNVWASGAATAAFDAFGDAVPADGLDDAQSLTSGVIDQPLDQTVDSALDSRRPITALTTRRRSSTPLSSTTCPPRVRTPDWTTWRRGRSRPPTVTPTPTPASTSSASSVLPRSVWAAELCKHAVRWVIAPLRGLPLTTP